MGTIPHKGLDDVKLWDMVPAGPQNRFSIY